MERAALELGEQVRDGLGHWYEVVEIVPSGGRARVQPLTWIGTPARLHPFGTPCWSYRSDLRKAGE